MQDKEKNIQTRYAKIGKSQEEALALVGESQKASLFLFLARNAVSRPGHGLQTLLLKLLVAGSALATLGTLDKLTPVRVRLVTVHALLEGQRLLEISARVAL